MKLKLHDSFAEQRICILLQTAMKAGFDQQACNDIVYAALLTLDVENIEVDTLIDFNDRFVTMCFHVGTTDKEHIRQIYIKSYAVYLGDEASHDGADAVSYAIHADSKLTEHLKDVKPMDIFSELAEYFKP